MINFRFFNPTEIIFGKGTETQVGSETRKYGKRILMVHYCENNAQLSGLYDRIVKSLKEAGLEFMELSGVKPNPRLDLVNKGIEICRKNNIDFILAVGGGSVIDTAKAIAVGVKYEGDVWDFFMKKSEPLNALPIGVVLTIPAAGSEVSNASVITNEAKLIKTAIINNILFPRFSIMNPELTFTLPPYQTACGIVDIMSHVMERYFTDVNNVDLTDRLCEATLKTVINYGPLVLEDPNNYNARAEIMWSGAIAHNYLLETGREPDWASHDIEHQLSAKYDIAHGAGLAIVFLAWMRYVYKHDINRFVQFAVRVWEVDCSSKSHELIAIEGISQLEKFFKKLNMPTRLTEVDIKDDNLERMAYECAGKKTVGVFVKLNSEDVFNIYKSAI